MGLSIATQQLAIAGRDLSTKAFLAKPGACSYTRRHRGYCEMRVEIENPEDAAALEAAAYKRVLRWWRNGVNRFNGQIVEHEETSSGLVVVAKDPWYNAGFWRRVRADVTYDGISDGAIVEALLDLQNGYEPTGLRMGSADATETRAEPREFLAGDFVGEKVEYLSRIVDGFGYVVEAVDGVPGTLAELEIRRPQGVQRPAAVFEFGPGTRQTLDDYARRSRQLVNRKSVIDEDNDVGTYESPTSVPLHGLWEDERGHVTTNDSDEILARLALEGVSDAVLYELSLAPGPTAPQLWTDFDVGDDVYVLVRRRGVALYSGFYPVELATVAFDADSGAEMLDELVVELPGEEDA